MTQKRCINCKSRDVRIAYDRKNDIYIIKCLNCSWTNKYFEELKHVTQV